METKKISVFCANEQVETPHTLDVDSIGEIVLTCVNDLRTPEEIEATDPVVDPKLCGRFLKFPKGTTAETLKEFLVKHKGHNEGQVSVASLEAEKEKLMNELFPKEEKEME